MVAVVTHTRAALAQALAEATGQLARVLRGLLAVVALLGGALDALITAAVGIPRLAWITTHLARMVASEYRRGYHNAIDVEILTDTPTPSPPTTARVVQVWIPAGPDHTRPPRPRPAPPPPWMEQ